MRDPAVARCAGPSNHQLDNGTELTSNAILKWADDHKVAWHYIAPGNPVQNAFRSAALRYTDGSAPRTAVITAQEGNVERQTPTTAG
jgi:transposase InsO family protein